MPTSIRSKLLLYAAVLLVLPTLAYGLLTFRAAKDALEPSLHDHLADDADTVKAALKQLLDGHIRNTVTWTGVDVMRELVVNDIDKSVSLFLEDLKHHYGAYLDLMALDPEGSCIASSNPAFIGRNLSLATAGLPSRGIDGVRVSRRVTWSKDHGEYYLGITATIPDPDSRNGDLGLLLVFLDTRVFQSVVLPKAGHGYVNLRLLDEERREIAGPEPRPARLRSWDIQPPSGVTFDSRSSPLLYEASDSEGRKFTISEVGLGTTDMLPDLGWTVTAAKPTKATMAPVVRMGRQMMFFGSGVTLFGLALAWLISSSISEPIKRLTTIASRIADKGTLEAIPDPISSDEVGELTLSFQKMVRNVAAAHDDLLQSAKLAFLGEMAAGIAHDVRTPLGIIKNSAQLIERRMKASDDAEGQEFARFICEETDRLNSVVTGLLDYARHDPPERGSADINAIVEKSINMLGTEAASKSVALRCDLDDSLPQVYCDSSQIQQVLLNLLMNAIQACGKGGWVRISTSRDDDGVRVVVKDNGPGMPDDVLQNVFSPFYSKREGGIGLGLAIVQRIVASHHGNIRACNAPDGGAEFTVTLPEYDSA
ncbi:MAG: ATP-binding protein [Candidatus Binatia bacterium]